MITYGLKDVVDVFKEMDYVGAIYGTYIRLYESGQLKEIGDHKFGQLLKYIAYNENGSIILREKEDKI